MNNKFHYLSLLVMVLMTSQVSAQESSPPPETAANPATESAFSRSATMGGGMGMGGMGMGGGGMGGMPGYEATWYPAQNLKGQPGDFGLLRQGLSVAAPIWKQDGEMLLANLSIRNSMFYTNAILPDTQRAFPDELWNINIGTTYIRRFENGWTTGLMLGFGSASDKPFHTIREMTANVLGFLRVPAWNERDAWQFSLFYMSNGPVPFPIPMISYVWNPNDQLRVNFGLPLSVQWMPSDEWQLNMSYVPLLNVNARLTYRPTQKLSLYTGYEFMNESWFLADRSVNLDRFFGIEQRVLTGLQYNVYKNLNADLFFGYAFGRYYGEGNNQFGSLRDKVNISPGLFTGLRISLRF